MEAAHPMVPPVPAPTMSPAELAYKRDYPPMEVAQQQAKNRRRNPRRPGRPPKAGGKGQRRTWPRGSGIGANLRAKFVDEVTGDSPDKHPRESEALKLANFPGFLLCEQNLAALEEEDEGSSSEARLAWRYLNLSHFERLESAFLVLWIPTKSHLMKSRCSA
eukprot:symbB.v1.2.040428.t3/scaffold7225.1/size12519/1